MDTLRQWTGIDLTFLLAHSVSLRSETLARFRPKRACEGCEYVTTHFFRVTTLSNCAWRAKTQLNCVAPVEKSGPDFRWNI